MKLFVALIALFFLSNCSFDNKSGIWKSENFNAKKDKNVLVNLSHLALQLKNLKKLFI